MNKGKWKQRKIAEVCEVFGGTTPSTTNPAFWDGELPWISPAELTGNRYIYDSVKKITRDAVLSKSLKLLPVNSVVLSSRAPIGKVAINKIPLYFNQGFKNIVCGPEVLCDFLYWWLWGKTDFLNSLGSGATFKEISKKVVENITIPVPPLAEQQEIVTYLDNAFSKIDLLAKQAEESLANAKALFQASLKEMLEPKKGWEEKKLKDICVISGNYGLSVSSKPFDGVRYLRITDITEMGDLNNECVSADICDDKSQEKLKDGDILFARTGATVGKTLIYKDEFGECLFAGYLIRYRLNKEIVLPRYMYYVTHSPRYYEWVQANQKAAAQPNISAKLYDTLLVGFPDVSEQKKMIEKLDLLKDNISQLQENYNKILTECQALKQALLREVFE